MDTYIKRRKPIRTALTKLCNEIEGTIRLDPINLQVRRDLRELREKLRLVSEQLGLLDEEVVNQMIEDDVDDVAIQTEHENGDAYRDRVIHCKLAIDEILEGQPDHAARLGAAANPVDKTYKLPKIEVKKFKVAILDWLGWWAQFSKIHEDANVHNSDKFQYLVQAMVEGTTAAALVNSYPQTADNYPKVIEALKDRFGNKHLLKRVYVGELLKMTMKNSREATKISDIYDKLEGHIKILGSLGITSEMMNVLLMPLIEASLPEDILTAWQRRSNFGKNEPNNNPPKMEFDFLMEFLRQEVRNQGQREMSKQSFGETQQSHPKEKKSGYSKKSDIPTAASLHVTSKLDGGCIFCDRPGHRSEDCFKGRAMDKEQRQKKIRESGRCFICLKAGHGSKNCKTAVKCFKCDGKHLTILCYGDRKMMDKSSNSQSDQKRFERKEKENETKVVVMGK